MLEIGIGMIADVFWFIRCLLARRKFHDLLNLYVMAHFCFLPSNTSIPILDLEAVSIISS